MKRPIDDQRCCRVRGLLRAPNPRRVWHVPPADGQAELFNDSPSRREIAAKLQRDIEEIERNGADDVPF